MTLLNPALSAPSLVAGQLYFQGLTMGAPPSTAFGITKLEGLDKPDVRSGNSDRPRTRGAFIGSNLLKTRTPTATMDIGPPYTGYANLAAALGGLRAAVSTEGAVEYPLWVKVKNFNLLVAQARVIKTNLPWDITADMGLLKGGSIQWEATDPYLYSTPTRQTTVGLATPGTGFSFPLTFNLSFGGALSPNQMSVSNAGNVTCWPTFVINGPCVNPAVQNTSLSGEPFLRLDMTVNSGDVVVVDCDQGTVLYTASGQTVGVPYQQVIAPGSTFFGIPAGSTSVISFNSQDIHATAGTLTVWSADAYDGLS